MGSETDFMTFKVNELVKDAKLAPPTVKLIDRAVASVIDAIRVISDSVVGADAAPGFIGDLGVPADKIAFTFQAPESFVIAGSHSIRSMAKPDVNVDLLIRMPRKCFLEKDYLNHRYHAKRCLYLAVIKEHLKSCPAVRKISWSTFQNEARKPVLLVYPAPEIPELSSFFIRIIPAATSVFNVSRMSFARNNVRAANNGGPTPRYNMSILEDMFLEENADFISKTFKGWRCLEEALILLKIWARNRSSLYAQDGVNGFLLSVILSLLAVGKGGNLINNSMGALQIFRIALKFIATSTSWTKGLSLKVTDDQNSSRKERELCGDLFDVIVFDASGYSNLFFRMRKTALSELRDEASLALDCMTKCRDGGFEGIFMTKVDFPAKFDLLVRINMKGLLNKSSFYLDEELPRTYEEQLHSILTRALSDRTKMIRVIWRSTPPEREINDGISGFGLEPVHVGVLFSSLEKISRVVDIGPHADKKEEAAKFREFWGEKAELRRFKDGTIAESTVWECPLWKRHHIVQHIIEHILSLHLSLSNNDMTQIVNQLDFCLLHGTLDPISFSGGLLEAFERLSKCLRQLDGLPLKISSVQPLDPAFRSTAVFPPEPNPLADKKVISKKSLNLSFTSIQPLDIMIQLEGSGLWPLDELAIEKTKTAWLLEIAKKLKNGSEEVICDATDDDVDVMFSGYAFRLRILHERGLKLMLNQVGTAAVKGVSSWDRELFLRSQHSSMINGLLGRFPCYGPVVRLAKRWISSHFFSSLLAEEAVELLVAHLFLNPLPFSSPCSRVSGFLRFLRLLANYDWAFSPLIVDINNDMTLEDKKEINEAFILSRKSQEENLHDVQPAMFLATSIDKASQAWTKSSPTETVLKRLVSYARSSAELMTSLMLKSLDSPYTWECLFKTPLSNYDAVVLLHKDKLSYPQRLLFTSEMTQGKNVIKGKPTAAFSPYIDLKKKESIESSRNSLMVGFDPTKCFVEDLKKEFSGAFSVWYDVLGADAMGLTWIKSASKKRERDEVGGERDPLSVLKEVGEAGKGFVRSVYLLKAPRYHL